MSRIKSVRFISSPRWAKRSEGRGQRPQGPGSPTTHPAPRAPEHAGRQQAARTKKRLDRATRRVVHPRYLFVQRHLSKTERKPCGASPGVCPSCARCAPSWSRSTPCSIGAGGPKPPWTNWPHCGGASSGSTALGDTLKKLFAPPWEKALTFLDDKLLPSTSNAVERGNRRYRKMQQQVSRVRTQVQIRARLALDMWREAQAEGRQQTLASLHHARAG